MKKWVCTLLSLLILLSLLAPATMPSAAQVVHENPNDLYPSSDITVEESLNYLIDWLQEDLQAITVELYNYNFTTAKEYYQYYNYSTN